MNLNRHILLSFLFAGLFSCSDHITNNFYDTEVGFNFRTYASWDSLVTLNVYTDKVLNSIPSITLDGRQPDSPKTSIANWSFSKLESNKYVHYKIVYNGDTLGDSIFLARKIDSLFINNQFVANHDSVLLSYDTMYVLSWRNSSNAIYSFLSTYSYMTSTRIDSVILGTSFNLFPKFDTNYLSYYSTLFIDIRVNSILTKNRSAGSPPDKRSKGLFAYYYIENQIYGVRLKVK